MNIFFIYSIWGFLEYFKKGGCVPIFFIAVSLLLIGCGRPDIANLDSSNQKIICFGDSITQGVGVKESERFCSCLSEKLQKPVMIQGVSGETSRDALKRLETDVLVNDPKLVLIEFGANDFFRKIPQEETFQNIDKIVSKVQARGAIAVILTVKTNLMGDSYYQGLKQVAKKRKALIIPNIMKGILFDPNLKVDSIHPNAEGHKMIADKVYQGIKPILEYL